MSMLVCRIGCVCGGLTIEVNISLVVGAGWKPRETKTIVIRHQSWLLPNIHVE